MKYQEIMIAKFHTTKKTGISEYSVASEPLNPLQRAIHSE